ncbi:MAG: transketolase [Betaproteobacteria bacterium TMED82]|nr:MAG: transketolase [Betaproteobacteria bacterium TMED82]|tara:strand:+ start:111193 stop:112053 length:861 start_codon:yes stop_codon:yes gene_type:complete
MKHSIQELRKIAEKIRYRIVRNSYFSGTPHLGSCLSCVDLLVTLYWNILEIDPNNPSSKFRDRFILSKGHAAPALFQILGERGFFLLSKLENYGKNGSIFGEHPPAPKYLSGIEAATGSLGHGLPMGLGMALAAKINKLAYQVFVIVSDGECNEGSIWEAAMLASAKRASNLTVFIDYNKWQATGRSKEILKIDPLIDKWTSFGWHAVEIDGHNMEEIYNSTKEKNRIPDKPFVAIAHTTKGKGVSFMEDDNNWHYRIPNLEEVEAAARELNIKETNLENRRILRH